MSKDNIAVLISDTEPTPAQVLGIKKKLAPKFGDLKLAFKKDDSVQKGFILKIGDQEFDWTEEGRLRQFREYISEIDVDSNIIPILKKSVEKWKLHVIPEEIGFVISVGDGIAVVSGLENAAYGEILMFEDGIRGMVSDLKEDTIGCILFDEGDTVVQGSAVHRTGKEAGVPVGENFIGRVINPLGVAIDGKGEVVPDGYSPIEVHAPEIIDRQPVKTPLETGILAIDSMFPIGRGQRELIIGDRQTGKSTIALDTILNQKGKNVICVYVAIGQKASSVASIVQTLKDNNAMDYTVVVSSCASDPASTQYIAPYAGCAIAEYFMKSGRDALIVYDDLSKHAVAYRTLSLLLGKAPGREAYPGDIFYLHSRLLERSAKLSDKLGGGSLTALPIVETQAGDVSAYIPTNVISITDGQIFLETDLFFSGQRPAINVGLSVSRVGGDAQTKAMKKSCGTLRLDLAQYREMEVFTQFAGELDDATKNQLIYGRGLMNILKQKQHKPYSRLQQVIILLTALNRKTIGMSDKEALEYFDEVYRRCMDRLPEVCSKISENGIMDEADREAILNVAASAVNKQ